MTNWLVTGGEGFIGRRIVQLSGAKSFDTRFGDSILNAEGLSTAFNGIEGVFHCAAKISVPESVIRPEEYYQINVKGTEKVIRAATHVGAKIVFSSSAAVYGESDHPVVEAERMNPCSPYAQNKRDGESLLQSSRVPAVILRYFNVYGPGQSPAYAGAVAAFIQAALKGEDLVIYGSGEQIRDFVYVDDVARANIAAMEMSFEDTEIFNIGSGTPISIKQLAEEVVRLTKSSSVIRCEPFRAGDIVYSQADVSKAAEKLGWKAEISFQEGLLKTIESYI